MESSRKNRKRKGRAKSESSGKDENSASSNAKIENAGKIDCKRKKTLGGDDEITLTEQNDPSSPAKQTSENLATKPFDVNGILNNQDADIDKDINDGSVQSDSKVTLSNTPRKDDSDSVVVKADDSSHDIIKKIPDSSPILADNVDNAENKTLNRIPTPDDCINGGESTEGDASEAGPSMFQGSEAVPDLPAVPVQECDEKSSAIDSVYSTIIEPGRDSSVSCTALTQPYYGGDNNIRLGAGTEVVPVNPVEGRQLDDGDNEIVFKDVVVTSENVKIDDSTAEAATGPKEIFECMETSAIEIADHQEMNDLKEVVDKNDLHQEAASMDDLDMTDSQFMSVDMPVDSSEFEQNKCYRTKERLPHENVCPKLPQLHDGTKMVKDLIREVSFLNKLILKMKREIDLSRRKQQPAQNYKKSSTLGGLNRQF